MARWRCWIANIATLYAHVQHTRHCRLLPPWQDTFKAYCANKPDMDGKGFVKLCKDCELVDDSLTLIDADLIFAKVVSRGHRRIILRQFKEALRLIAERKGMDEDEICQRVAESEGVVHEGTTANYVRFFDDKSTYTGTHVYGGRIRHMCYSATVVPRCCFACSRALVGCAFGQD